MKEVLHDRVFFCADGHVLTDLIVIDIGLRNHLRRSAAIEHLQTFQFVDAEHGGRYCNSKRALTARDQHLIGRLGRRHVVGLAAREHGRFLGGKGQVTMLRRDRMKTL